MVAPVIAVAANAGSALTALENTVLFIVSIIGASAAVTEAGRRKKAASEAKAAEQAARQKAADDFARVGPFADALKKAMERAQEDDCSKRKEMPHRSTTPCLAMPPTTKRALQVFPIM